MKIQCDLCKEIVPIGEFEIADGGIRVTCTSCGDGFFVPSGGSQATSAPPPTAPVRPSSADGDAGETMSCPKCETVQPTAEACRSCGLLAAGFDDFGGGDSGGPDELETAWAACQDNWSDESTHERLLELVSASRAFAWGARRYRSALRERPGDEIAEDRIDRLARMVEAEMLSLAVARSTEQTAASQPYKGVVIVLLALLLVGAAGGIYLLIKRSGQTAEQPAVRQRNVQGPAQPGKRSPIGAPTKARPSTPAPAPRAPLTP